MHEVVGSTPTVSIFFDHLACERLCASEFKLLYIQSPIHSERPISRPTTVDALPPTARSIALLLASTPTVQDAQPGVLHQLLEFSHRYTTQVLSDALVYAEHGGRSGKIEMDDVVLAVQARVGWEFGGRVPKEVRGNYWTSRLLMNSGLIYSFYAVHAFACYSNQCSTASICS